MLNLADHFFLQKRSRFHVPAAGGKNNVFTKYDAILHSFFTRCDLFLHFSPEIQTILQFGKDLVTRI